MTLLELVVALVLLGVMAALALPSLSMPARRDGRLEVVLRAARGAAIARAQSLALTVGRDGGWTLRPLSPDDTTVTLRGALDSPPSAPFQLQLTPLGTCIPATPLPGEYDGWDAAACAPRRAASSTAGGEA